MCLISGTTKSKKRTRFTPLNMKSTGCFTAKSFISSFHFDLFSLLGKTCFGTAESFKAPKTYINVFKSTAMFLKGLDHSGLQHMHVHLRVRVCCKHEGKTCTDQTAQVLTQNRRRPFRLFSPGGQTQWLLLLDYQHSMPTIKQWPLIWYVCSEGERKERGQKGEG